MPRPEDVKGVQRLNGFVNYLAKFLPKLLEIMETLMSHEVPSQPWERVGADIFTLDGKDYLVTID